MACAVAAGEHMHEFEEFEASKFVSRLLGKGDWKGFIDKVQVRGVGLGGGRALRFRACGGRLDLT